MPLLNARSSAVSVRVRTEGGRRMEKFIGNATDRTRFAAAATKVLRRRLLPKLKREVPVLTGLLQSSLRLRQEGYATELRGVDYAPDVRWQRGGGGTTTVSKTAGRLLKRHHRIIARDINKELSR